MHCGVTGKVNDGLPKSIEMRSAPGRIKGLALPPALMKKPVCGNFPAIATPSHSVVASEHPA
jgi:hypothetical protein